MVFHRSYRYIVLIVDLVLLFLARSKHKGRRDFREVPASSLHFLVFYLG